MTTNKTEKNINILQNIKEIRWVIVVPAYIIGFFYGTVGIMIVLGIPTVIHYGDVTPSKTGMFVFMLLFGTSSAAYFAAKLTPIHKSSASIVTASIYSLGIMVLFSRGMSSSHFIAGSILGLLVPSYIIYKIFKYGDKFRIKYYTVILFVILMFFIMFFLIKP